METLKFTDLTDLPSVVDIVTAARALGLSRSHAYDLAKRDVFPCRVVRIGHLYRVPTADLLQLLSAGQPDTQERPGAGI
jgi:predicted DNA-binding transcriptional regulator AlpA